MWDPQQYAKFAAERSRPFTDLLARVDLAPARVVGLGCGSGTLTHTLCERWPTAVVTGVDSSEAMIRDAAGRSLPDRLRFVLGDLTTWAPEEPVDLVVANAVLQWLPDHLDLLGRLASFVAPGGVIAFHVPGNLQAPSHTIVRDLRVSSRWRDRVGEGADRNLEVAQPSEYLDALLACDLHPDVWESTYLQLLTGEDPVLEWLKGAALRPVLDRLDEREREAFCAELGPLLRSAYPSGERGTVLPYRRIFAVASRGRAGLTGEGAAP